MVKEEKDIVRYSAGVGWDDLLRNIAWMGAMSWKSLGFALGGAYGEDTHLLRIWTPS